MKGSATSFISIADWTRVIDAQLLERILQRQRVDHGRQHAHIVAADAIHACRAHGDATNDIAAADRRRHLDADRVKFR